jgi:cyclase
VRTAKIERVRDGVYAAIAEADGVAVGNAGFVDLGGETLVFDTHVSLAAGRELRAAAEQLGPVRTVVLSHWHGDHVYGAGAFDADVNVVATAGTAVLMRERTAPRIDAMKARPLEEFDGTPFAEIARTELQALELRLPDATFEEQRAFVGKKRTAQALTYGGGHTLSDGVLWLPAEKILFAADLVVVGSHGWVGDGDVTAWPRILERLAGLEPETIVPGHGPVAGPEAIEFMLRYLDAVTSAGPAAPNPFPDLALADGWEGNLEALAAAS